MAAHVAKLTLAIRFLSNWDLGGSRGRGIYTLNALVRSHLLASRACHKSARAASLGL
jgi:hypothetical protein